MLDLIYYAELCIFFLRSHPVNQLETTRVPHGIVCTMQFDEQVSEEDVTLSLTNVSDAATALGDLTKSSPKRKSGVADAKSKPKAAKKAKK